MHRFLFIEGKGMEMQEMATVLSTLGNDALMAFIIVHLLGFIEVMTMFGLITWATRTVWKSIKKHTDLD